MSAPAVLCRGRFTQRSVRQVMRTSVSPVRATQYLHDWRELLADSKNQWRPGYSAMATAQAWQSGFPADVARLLAPDAKLQLAIIEHKVPMPGGGFPSQCDVFALVHGDGRDMAVAVEAKVDEPFGPTLKQWHPVPSANKSKRLGTICDWLGLSDPDPGLRYQLFHRTAAAIVEARRFRRPVAAMIVQSFSPTRRWFADYAAFCALLKLDAAPDCASEKTLPCGLILRLGWACGDPKHLEKHMTCGCKNKDCDGK